MLAPVVRAQEARTKVVVVTCPQVINEQDVADAGAVRAMLEHGITALAGKEQVEDGWRALVRPEDKVALVDSGTWLLNVPAVPVEIARGLALAKPARLTLTSCALAAGNAAYISALKAGLERVGLPAETLDSRIYSIPGKFHQEDFTLIAMAPTLKSHSIAGVSGVVKHYATMSKTHVREYHANAMETAGKVLGEEFSRHRHLTIVDALRWGDNRKGPQYYRKCLIFGTDPVATDVIALQLFLENCKTHGSIPPDRHRLLADTRYHAGISDPNRIEVVKVAV